MKNIYYLKQMTLSEQKMKIIATDINLSGQGWAVLILNK